MGGEELNKCVCQFLARQAGIPLTSLMAHSGENHFFDPYSSFSSECRARIQYKFLAVEEKHNGYLSVSIVFIHSVIQYNYPSIVFIT